LRISVGRTRRLLRIALNVFQIGSSGLTFEKTFEDFCWADAQDAVQKEKFSQVIPLFALLHKMTVAVTFENFYQADAQDVVQK